MQTPNARQSHNPKPAYLRGLIRRAGMTQHGAAERIGVSARTMRNYLSMKSASRAPYHVQFALERLAAGGRQVRVLLRDPAAVAALDRLTREHGSIRAAIEHALRKAGR